VIGYYYTIIYFPIAVAALFSFASNQLLLTVTNGEGYATQAQNLSFVIAVAFVFMIIIGTMNTVAAKPGRIFQNIGTLVKTLPIVFTVGFLIFVVVTNAGEINFPTDLSTVNGQAIDTTVNPFMLLMISLPPILFSIDGFLFAGSLSKEGKSKKTFPIASIIGIITIILLYLLFTIAVFGLGNPEAGGYGTLSNVIDNQFSDSIAK
jgi:APA family basic amino acid/polyamine antiporter